MILDGSFCPPPSTPCSTKARGRDFGVVASCRTAFQAAMSGDLRALHPLREAGGAWKRSADLLGCLAGLDASPDDGTALRERSADGSTEELGLSVLWALLRLDQVALGRLEARLAERGPEAELHALRAAGWRLVFAGDSKAGHVGATLYGRASSDGDAFAAVEGEILRAAGAMLQEDLKGALELIRRAARMAQSEHLWLSHYLASVLLCRIRRLNGQTHLASRIAEACIAVTAPPWHGLLRWERLFAGSAESAPTDHPTDLGADAASVESWLRGECGRPDLKESVRRSALHARDFEALARAMGAETDDADDDVGRWIRGEDALIPGRIAGAAALRGNGEESGAKVFAKAAGRSRRTIGAPDVGRLGPAGSQPTRVDTIIAVLVLRNGVVQRDELFASVYGFPYRPAIHEATFKVLRSQAKQHVAAFADLQSADGYRALIHRDFVFRDPRCQQPLGEIMLRFLGHTGKAGAKDLAKQLGVPLRTVQQALRGLVDDGACAVRKDGRRVEYVVEDTTFCEITVA